jgi:hypothetical protein
MQIESAEFNSENNAPSSDLNFENRSFDKSLQNLATKNRSKLTIDVSEPSNISGHVVVVLRSPSALEKIFYIEDELTVPLPPGMDEVLTPKPRIKATRLTTKPRTSLVVGGSASGDWYMIEPSFHNYSQFCPTNKVPFVGVDMLAEVRCTDKHRHGDNWSYKTASPPTFSEVAPKSTILADKSSSLVPG